MLRLRAGRVGLQHLERSVLGVAEIIGLAGSVAVGKSTTARILRALLSGEVPIAVLGSGAMVSAVGVALGLVLGWVVSLLLVQVVNRQSFHWSMDLAAPWLPLGLLALALVAAATGAAAWAARRALSGEVLRAVREDW